MLDVWGDFEADGEPWSCEPRIDFSGTKWYYREMGTILVGEAHKKIQLVTLNLRAAEYDITLELSLE